MFSFLNKFFGESKTSKLIREMNERYYKQTFIRDYRIPVDMIWKEELLEQSTEIVPKYCPDCKSVLILREHDWHKIEDSGQFMVHTYHCPNYHGYYYSMA